jgi:hypothetical protein
MEAGLTLGLDWAGDGRTFESLLETHQRQVFRLAYRLTGNVEDAKDVSQEVLLKLRRSLRTLDGQWDLSPSTEKMPADLEPVVKQLRSAFSYPGYELPRDGNHESERR